MWGVGWGSGWSVGFLNVVVLSPAESRRPAPAANPLSSHSQNAPQEGSHCSNTSFLPVKAPLKLRRLGLLQEEGLVPHFTVLGVAVCGVAVRREEAGGGRV